VTSLPTIYLTGVQRNESPIVLQYPIQSIGLVARIRVLCGLKFLHDPVSSEISDFTPFTHTQSNILHTKYDDKTDY